MKQSVISLLKKNGFMKCDTNLYDDHAITIGKDEYFDRLYVRHSSGEDICTIPNNYYAVIGFIYTKYQKVKL